MTGDGRTALRGSAARYYYILPTTGTPLDSVNPNSTYQVTYNWNDINHDLHFQPGEQIESSAGVTSGTTTTVSPSYRRPYTNEYTAGLDRDLGQALKLSVNYTYRQEKYPQADTEPGSAVLDDADDRDGSTGRTASRTRRTTRRISTSTALPART